MEWSPQISATFGTIPEQYGYCVSPPVAWVSLANGWSKESNTYFDGRFKQGQAALHGTGVPKIQDAYATSPGRSGRQFTIVSGFWKDDYYHNQFHAYGLQLAAGSPGVSGEIVSSDTTVNIEHAEIILYRGNPPIVTSGQDLPHTRAGNYAYVHLAYDSPDLMDY